MRKSAAFTALTAKAGMDASRRIGHALFSFEGGQAVADDLLRAGATALICGSDVLALGAVRAARRLGLDVPGDVSVVGYDDSAFMNYTDPPTRDRPRRRAPAGPPASPGCAPLP